MRSALGKRIQSLVLIFIFFTQACSENLLSSVASKTGDDYLFEEAYKANNRQDYDVAIEIITTKMSGSGQLRSKTKELLAGSYAGKCGLNFVNYTNSFVNATSTAPFKLMMTPFVGVSANSTYCKLALSQMDSIGSSADRTINQNTFVAIVALALMGTALREYADTSPTLGDGTADVNLCTGVTDAQIEDVIRGFGYFTLNIGFVSASLLGSSSFTLLSDLTAGCVTVLGASCSTTDPSTISPPAARAALVAFFRDWMNTQEYGIGTYSTGGDDLLLPAACP